jgi:hypothetical protein
MPTRGNPHSTTRIPPKNALLPANREIGSSKPDPVHGRQPFDGIMENNKFRRREIDNQNMRFSVHPFYMGWFF